MISPSSATKEVGSADLVRTELKARKAVLTSQENVLTRFPT